MNNPPQLTVLLQFGGVIQLLIVLMNFFLPGLLRYRQNLKRTDMIIRQIFYVHNLYIVLMVLFFSVLCLVFPDSLHHTGTIQLLLTGFLGLFWGLRVVIQLGYYDQQLKETYWPVHLMFTGGITYLTGLFFLLFLYHIVMTF